MPGLVRASCILVLLGSLPRAQEVLVTWRGEVVTADAVRKENAAAADAAEAWAPFAKEAHYRLVLSDDARVLLVLSQTYDRKGPKKEHHDVEVMRGLMRDTSATVDRFLGPPIKNQPPVAIVCSRSVDYASVAKFVAKQDERLRDWADKSAKAVTGFILSSPLVGSWIEDPSGVEEWHSENELVHRTAQLLIRIKAPQLPPWLLLGLGWHVEDTVQRSVYCFPFRSSFVSEGEHTDWGMWLANNFRKAIREKAKKPLVLDIEEFATWKPSGGKDDFDSGKAYVAFGVSRYLAQECPAKLLPLAERLGALMEKGSKVMLNDRDWTTNPDYLVPAGEQLAALREVDADLLPKMTDWFVKKKANERHPVATKR
jgi:hypothetical protein